MDADLFLGLLCAVVDEAVITTFLIVSSSQPVTSYDTDKLCSSFDFKPEGGPEPIRRLISAENSFIIGGISDQV